MACYSLKELVHFQQDLYLVTTIGALVEKDGRIHHVEKNNALHLYNHYRNICSKVSVVSLLEFLFFFFSSTIPQ